MSMVWCQRDSRLSGNGVAGRQHVYYDVGMKIAELVKKERERLGWSARKLAEKAGVSPSTITRIEAGQRIGRSDTIAAIAQVLGIDPRLVQGAVSGDEEVAYPPERTPEEILAELNASIKRLRETSAHYEPLDRPIVWAQLVSSLAAAGEGAVPETEFVPYVPAPHERGHTFIAIRVRGDCLSPEVRSGEIAIIDRDASPQIGDIVAVLVGDESLLRIYRQDELVSLNDHPPIAIGAPGVHLQGVVVWAGRRPRA